MMASEKTYELSVSVGILVCLLVCFSGVAGHDLWTPDEPRVAAISLEMEQTGDAIIPRLAGKPFVEKPPLYFAVSALMLRLLGPVVGNVAALRLTAALFGVGVLLLSFGIAGRLYGRSVGFTAALILGTMEGFVENFHWIRVDAALAFFVLAAIFCAVEALYRGHPPLLVPAGVFAGCAFLAKGLIGPALIVVAFMGLAISGAGRSGWGVFRERSWISGAGLFFLSAAAVCSLWVVPFWLTGGNDLWHEWFWVNNFGRFSGTAAKAHMEPGAPFYYILQFGMYCLPWTPWVLFWSIREALRAIKDRSVTRESLFLATWAAGSLLLLTLSTTKRGIYLLPVLPVFAIMASRGVFMLGAEAADTKIARWFGAYTRFWVWLCIVILCSIAALPILAWAGGSLIPAAVGKALLKAGYLNGVSLACLLIGTAVAAGFGRRFSGPARIILTSAAAYIALFGVPANALDSVKSMKFDVQTFAAAIPAQERGRVAGTGFSETMRACFYFYCGWKVPLVDDPERIRAILENRDEAYLGVIVNRRRVEHPGTDLAKSSYNIVQQSIVGRDRGLFLIRGTNKQAIESASAGLINVSGSLRPSR